MSLRRSFYLGVAALSSVVAGTSQPCDIYAAGNTPCIAAHSTTRALYSSFNGPLYQVRRNSDQATMNIYPLSAGGVANAASQDKFCQGATCSITMIYDQSPKGNNLPVSSGGHFAGPAANGADNPASAIGAPVTLNGNKAYGVFVSPGVGYRNNSAVGTAEGNGPQGVYAVYDGTHYNAACCFDYGNAERSATDTGAGSMEAIYFGTGSNYGSGAGSGPWIMADLENGLYSETAKAKNENDPTQTSRFVTAVVKGEPGFWEIRGGNANSGELSTYFAGARPSGYNPMKLSGAIILGVGGDNSNGGQGTFYEGIMTATFPSNETENAVQANIVAAKYAAGQLNSGTALTSGSTVTFRVTTPGYTNRYIAHNGSTVNTPVITNSSSTATKQSAEWKVTTGLGNSNCYSFESVDTPGSYIYHNSTYSLLVGASDGTQLFAEDATFCTQTGLNGQGDSIRSWNYPSRYIRHYTNNVAYAAGQGGPEAFDSTTSYANDVSFIVGTTNFAAAHWSDSSVGSDSSTSSYSSTGSSKRAVHFTA